MNLNRNAKYTIDNENVKSKSIDTTKYYLNRVSPINLQSDSIFRKQVTGTDLDVTNVSAISSNLSPSIDNTYDMGSNTYSWKAVYAYTYYDNSGNTVASFKNIDCPSGTDPVADSLLDTLTLATANSNLTITGNATNDSVTFGVGESGLTATSGDVSIETVGYGVDIKEGANARMGIATLTAGTVTVNTTAVTANSRIMLTGQNSSGTHGELTISARTASTSFTITSSSATDTRDVAWIIFEPA